MKLMSLFSRILGFVVIIITLALALSIHTANYDILTEAISSEASSNVSTNATATDADIILVFPLYQNLVSNVTSVSSNITESPAANTYTTATRTLNVDNLTANTTRILTVDYTASENLTNLMGMEALAGFGAPLIILGLLVSGGIFAVAGVKGKLAASPGDLMSVIGSIIIVIVSLTLMGNVNGYTNTLIAASTGFAQTIYGIIPIIIYIGIIASAGWVTVSRYRRMRKGGGSRGKAYV